MGGYERFITNNPIRDLRRITSGLLAISPEEALAKDFEAIAGDADIALAKTKEIIDERLAEQEGA